MRITLETPLQELPFLFLAPLLEEAFLFPAAVFGHKNTLENSTISDLVALSGFHPDHVLQRLRFFIKNEPMPFLMTEQHPTSHHVSFVFLERETVIAEGCYPTMQQALSTIKAFEHPSPSHVEAIFWEDLIMTQTFFEPFFHADPSKILVMVSKIPVRAYSAAMHLKELGISQVYFHNHSTRGHSS